MYVTEHACAPVCEHTCVHIRHGKGGGAAAILPPEGRHPLERRQTATLLSSSDRNILHGIQLTNSGSERKLVIAHWLGLWSGGCSLKAAGRIGVWGTFINFQGSELYETVSINFYSCT